MGRHHLVRRHLHGSRGRHPAGPGPVAPERALRPAERLIFTRGRGTRARWQATRAQRHGPRARRHPVRRPVADRGVPHPRFVGPGLPPERLLPAEPAAERRPEPAVRNPERPAVRGPPRPAHLARPVARHRHAGLTARALERHAERHTERHGGRRRDARCGERRCCDGRDAGLLGMARHAHPTTWRHPATRDHRPSERHCPILERHRRLVERRRLSAGREGRAERPRAVVEATPLPTGTGPTARLAGPPAVRTGHAPQRAAHEVGRSTRGAAGVPPDDLARRSVRCQVAGQVPLAHVARRATRRPPERPARAAERCVRAAG